VIGCRFMHAIGCNFSYGLIMLFLVIKLYKGIRTGVGSIRPIFLISIGAVVESRGEINRVLWSGKSGATRVGPTR
jgi:hypothetical protein